MLTTNHSNSFHCKDRKFALFSLLCNNMNATQKSYLALHIAVLLYGLTAILGDLINLPAFSLVWWRVLITSFSLLFLVNVIKLYKKLPRRDIINFSLYFRTLIKIRQKLMTLFTRPLHLECKAFLSVQLL